MRVFLSHSSKDNVLAEKIYRMLRDQAGSVWLDKYELREGDLLTSSIKAGISSADAILVLLTENSIKSDWVRDETQWALDREVDGQGPRIIPLRMGNCEIPEHLKDRIWVSLDKQGNGIEQILPAIFRDSYFLEIRLNPGTLEIDRSDLRENLQEFCRCKLNGIRVRIDNHEFNRKIAEIAKRTAEEVTDNKEYVQQIERVAARFPSTMPIYWTNLADLASRLTAEIFSEYGKTLSALEVALTSLSATFRYAQCIMASGIQLAVQPYFAEKFGFSEIAHYMQANQGVFYSNAEEFHRVAFGLEESVDLELVELVGNADRRVADTKLYLADISDTDRISLQSLWEKPSFLIDGYAWYTRCIPQVIGSFLFWTAFREGKPLHEVDYDIGLNRDDYKRMGLA